MDLFPLQFPHSKDTKLPRDCLIPAERGSFFPLSREDGDQDSLSVLYRLELKGPGL